MNDMDYETLRLVVLNIRDKAVLVRKEGSDRQEWIPRSEIIRFKPVRETEKAFPIYSVVAHRWVFKQRGLI